MVFFGIIAGGATAAVFGYVEPYHEMTIAIGIAFMIAGGVGVFMMVITDMVAGGLHEGCNEQNDILRELVSSQKETNLFLTDLTASQKENHIELAGILNRIANTLENLQGQIGQLARDKHS